MEQRSYQSILKEARTALHQAGVPDAELDAWYLLADSFEISRSWFYLHGADMVTDVDALRRFWDRVQLRKTRRPLQYILGSQEFMGLPFKVNEQVLIPRQDTETLVELVLAQYAGKEKRYHILDMCTGSGCILLSLLQYGPFVQGTGVDLMPGALEVAKENGRLLGLPAEWIQSDLFRAVPETRFDVIVSNPPYISDTELASLEPEVRVYEPRTALFAEENGLYFYRKLAEQSPEWLTKGGRIYLEIGCEQGAAVKALFENAGFADVHVQKDLTGLDRVVWGVWPG